MLLDVEVNVLELEHVSLTQVFTQVSGHGAVILVVLDEKVERTDPTPEFVAVPLLTKWKISETSYVLRFGVPDTSKPLNLSTCACILAKAKISDKEGNIETVVRPYTPISPGTTNERVG